MGTLACPMLAAKPGSACQELIETFLQGTGAIHRPIEPSDIVDIQVLLPETAGLCIAAYPPGIHE